MREDKATNDSAQPRSALDRQSGLLQWAWEFLRRNPAYRASYARWSEVPEALKRADSMEMAESADLDDLSISWFDLEPSPIAGELFGTWQHRNASKERSWSLASEFDPSRFMLNQWLDPGQADLPVPGASSFFVWDIQLEEARVLERHADAVDGPGLVAATFLKLAPEMTRSPDGAVEHRVGVLRIAADRLTQVALRFDLAVPLDLQLASAKRQLLAALEDFKSTSEAGQITSWRSKENHADSWPKMIALLDAREKTKSDREAVLMHLQTLEEESGDDLSDLTDGLLTSLRRARELRDEGYRGLIMRAFEIR